MLGGQGVMVDEWMGGAGLGPEEGSAFGEIEGFPRVEDRGGGGVSGV